MSHSFVKSCPCAGVYSCVTSVCDEPRCHLVLLCPGVSVLVVLCQCLMTVDVSYFALV